MHVVRRLGTGIERATQSLQIQVHAYTNTYVENFKGKAVIRRTWYLHTITFMIQGEASFIGRFGAERLLARIHSVLSIFQAISSSKVDVCVSG